MGKEETEGQKLPDLSKNEKEIGEKKLEDLVNERKHPFELYIVKPFVHAATLLAAVEGHKKALDLC